MALLKCNNRPGQQGVSCFCTFWLNSKMQAAASMFPGAWTAAQTWGLQHVHRFSRQLQLLIWLQIWHKDLNHSYSQAIGRRRLTNSA
jgi:2,4-dienoyl-CoA reductase-like NADH-dependent reductase (Old Yellow Enzyme family)